MLLRSLRFAAGVCVLATGLLLAGAGGAIAGAAPDSRGVTTHRHHDVGASALGDKRALNTARSANSITTFLENAVYGATPGSGAKLSPPPFTSATSPNIVPGGTDSPHAKKDAAATLPTVIAEQPSAAAPVMNAVARVPGSVPPLTNVLPQTPDAVQPATNPLTQLSGLLGPVTNVVALVPDLVAFVPYLVATGFEVGAALLTAVAEGVAPLMELPFDAIPLLDVIAGEPATNAPGVTGVWPAAAAAASVPGAASSELQLPLPLPPAAVTSGPMVGNVSGVAMTGGIAAAHVSRDSSPSETPTAASNGARPGTVLSHLGKVVAKVAISASLAVLAANALPGVGGLGIFTAAGVRIGHRQAKAAYAVRSSGLARFARPGPLGVVRSGSLVAIHQRQGPASRLLDNAA